MISHDQECATTEPGRLDLRPGSDGRSADALGRRRRPRALGHEGRCVHDDSRAAAHDAPGAAPQGHRAAWSRRRACRCARRRSPRAGRDGCPSYIVAPVFPAWFVCEQVEIVTVDGKPARRRRLVRWQDLDPRGGRRKFIFDDGKKSDVTPIRFVCACEKGHLQDIDWKWVVHGSEPCQEPMWLEEKGTSADPADMTIVCGCGKQLSLQTLFQPGRMGNCRGERPWLLDRDPNGCDQKLKLLTRTATNTYFPQVYTVISLPSEEDELTRLVESCRANLTNVQIGAGRRGRQALQFQDRGHAGSLCGRGYFRAARAHSRRRDSRFRTFAEAVRVRRVRQRPAGDRAKSSDREALRPDVAARDLGRPERRPRSVGDQESRRRASLAGGVVPLRLHALRGRADVRGRRARGRAAGGARRTDLAGRGLAARDRAVRRRAFSSISTKPRSRNGSERSRRNSVTTSCLAGYGHWRKRFAASRPSIRERLTCCCTACRTR